MAGIVNVLGVRIDDVSADQLTALIDQFVATGRRARALYVNAHGLNLAHAAPWMRDYLNASEVVFADGVGVTIASRMLGHRSGLSRIPITDWIWDLAGLAATREYSMFLVGSRPGVADRAAERLRERHPGLKIAGTLDGYFDKTSGCRGNADALAVINAARPEIIVVGFGMPMQERWLLENRDEIDGAVVISGGAVLDYTAGEVRRGPSWLTNHGLEWLARLVIEPRRLWRRYVLGNPLFLWRVLRQRIAGGRAGGGGVTRQPEPEKARM